MNSNLFIAVSGVSRQLAGRAFRYNLFLFAKRANKKRIFTTIPNANAVVNRT